jgi:bromodomain adjacent to zinc finger domain protein 1A
MEKDEENDSEKQESEDDEEAESDDDEPPVKIRKIERKSGRRSTKKVFESDDSDNEVLSKKDNRKSGSRRSSVRPSRKNSPEVEDNLRGRRSSRKFVEETAAERRASKRSFDAFNTISLGTLIDEVIKHKNAWPFTKPVSTAEVPDYLEVIKTPMDFSKIKSKLNLGDYSSNEQAMKDVELVFFNCDLYNVANSEIYKSGAKLEKFVAKRCKDLNLPFTQSDMTK